MELSRLLAYLRSRALFIVAAVVVSALVAYAATSSIRPTYRAQATLVVDAGLLPTLDLDQQLAAQRAAKTYATLATTRPALNAVIAELHLNTTAEQLAKQLDVVADADIPFLTIAATDSDAATAALIANSLADVVVAASEATPVQGAPTATRILRIVDPATTPEGPSSPRVLFNTVLAAAVTLAALIFLVVMGAYLDERLRGPAELRRIVGVPVMARVALSNPDLAATSEEDLDAYRALYLGFVHAMPEGRAHVVVVTSPGEEEGKTLVATMLARAAARGGRRTILVDGNLRNPALERAFALPRVAGFSAALARGDRPSSSVAQAAAEPNLRVVASGLIPAHPGDLIASTRLSVVIGEFAADADLVVIDTPSLATAVDAAILASAADATIIVAQDNRTTRPALDDATEVLIRAGATIVGSVLTYQAGRGFRRTGRRASVGLAGAEGAIAR